MSDDDIIIAKALAEIRRLKAENAELRAGLRVPPMSERPALEPIAVIGFSCRTPGNGDTPDALWSLLQEGRSTIAEVPSYRWPVERYYDPDPDAPGKLRCRYGSFLGRVEDFDCKLFGISPVEASYMDPQQRLLLELAWEALEDANLAIDGLRGSATGVFIGQSGFDFATQHMTEQSLSEITPYVGTGCAFSPAAGRISYQFDFKGPSYVVDTACSSSLVAMHNACQSLRQGESTLALVGAVNMILAPGMSINFDKVGMLCEDGIVKTFDKDAHGVVRAEGGGMVVLKRLADALRDGDRIDGLILGSAISQDGASSSLMAPNGNSQRAVMQAALRAAGIDPGSVDVIEAHGTATPLGDPTELAAVLDVYCRTPRKPLVIGSVKTNFGHMEASAGMIGFIKLLLALRHEFLPPHLNYSEGHPDIDWEHEPIEVCTEGRSWPRGTQRRLAGLSGFGFSGTNAHVILAEAPGAAASSDASDTTGPQLLMLSAASAAGLNENAGALADWMQANPGSGLASLCFTWAARRKPQVQRLALVCGERQDTIARLRRFVETGKVRAGASGNASGRHGRISVAMVCGGHGAQYVGMAAALYAAEPVFRAALDRAIAVANQYCTSDLRILMHATPQAGTGKLFASNKVVGELGKTLHAQLAIFCVQYGLAQQWLHWGIQPKILLGHSLGEYTAACLADVFSLEDAVMLIAERARLMEVHTPPGAMITAFHDEAAVAAVVAEFADAGIAAVNGPGIILVSGSTHSVEEIARRIDALGGRSSSVAIDRAFHSPLVDAVMPQFRRVLERVSFAPPRIPIISNVSGKVVGPELTTVDYWLRHSRDPVRFMEGMQLLHSSKYDAFIDLSPEPVMMGLDLCYQDIRDKAGSRGVWVPSLRKGSDDQALMLESLGRLYCVGLNPDWQKIARDKPAALRLPTYRFDRQRCWSAAAERGQQLEPASSEAGNRPALAAVPAAAYSVVETALPQAPASRDDLHRVMLEHMAVVDQYLALADANNPSGPV